MKKHFTYLRYLIRHKYYVWVAGRVLRVSIWRLIKHDWTKCLPCEWIPYVNFFYGSATETINGKTGPQSIRTTIETRRAFDLAWLHHQHHNDHHFQHYILHQDSGELVTLEMPEDATREMAADFCGAGKAITGKWGAEGWYYANKDNIILHPATRAYLEDYLRYAMFVLNREEND